MTKDPIEIIKEYVRFPSISTDSEYLGAMEGARGYVSKLLKRIGFEVETIATDLHPAILAKREGVKGYPHILLYGHYDVQPAGQVDLWDSHPFEPIVRGNRIYGRGTADNKGPQIALLMGLARCLEKYPDLPLNITVLIEGEEEIGSPSFNQILQTYGAALKADCVIFSDTSSPSLDQVAITTGLRGIVGLEVTVAGPSHDLHSGLHGGPVLNPIRALCQLCASLHDDTGLVNIRDFYDAVLLPETWERLELKKLAITPESYLRFLGIEQFCPTPGFDPLEAVRFSPTLEFNGIGGGYQAEGSKTIIPSKAFAKITCRLVPNQDPNEIAEKLSEALHARCPEGVSLIIKLEQGGAPYSIIPPHRTSNTMIEDSTLARCFKICEEGLQDVFGNPPLFLRGGGSIPMVSQLKTTLGMDSIMIGLGLPEDSPHAPNESFHLDMLHKGMQSYEKIFARIAGLT
jgi:acetylornithine deacetylase/succinyl-diaminopimelate desuccinylase-like protein